MLITNHVLAGTIVGALAPGRTVALAGGVASHVMLDVAPHFRVPPRHFLTIAVCDGIAGLAVSGAVLATCRPQQRGRIAAGILGACLPDLDKPGRELVGRSPFPGVVDHWHGKIQTELPGLAPVEALTAVCLGLLARRLTRRSRRD